jgi:hypothetical protein
VAKTHPASEDVENAAIKKQKEEFSGVGSMDIFVYRTSAGELDLDSSESEIHFQERSYESKVHEKVLKGEPKSHGVTYVSRWTFERATLTIRIKSRSFQAGHSEKLIQL